MEGRFTTLFNELIVTTSNNKRSALCQEIKKLFVENNVIIYAIIYFGEFLNEEDCLITDNCIAIIKANSKKFAKDSLRNGFKVEEIIDCFRLDTNIEIFEMYVIDIFSDVSLNEFLYKNYIKTNVFTEEDVLYFEELRKL